MYVKDPKLSTLPVETKAVIEEELRMKLVQPIHFIYHEGKVKEMKVAEGTPLWIINLQKGIINMLQLDVLGFNRQTLNEMYTKPEVSEPYILIPYIEKIFPYIEKIFPYIE